jgi:HNH endonuclease
MSSGPKLSTEEDTYEYPFSTASESLKLKVWSKGRPIPNCDPGIWRWDMCGKLMRYSEHGNTDSDRGWEIDYIFPRAKGGTDEVDNLQPLNWRTNRRKSDTYPYYCQ